MTIYLFAVQAEESQVSANLEYLYRQSLILGMENQALRQRLVSLSQEQLAKYRKSLDVTPITLLSSPPDTHTFILDYSSSIICTCGVHMLLNTVEQDMLEKEIARLKFLYYQKQQQQQWPRQQKQKQNEQQKYSTHNISITRGVESQKTNLYI